MGDVGGAGVVKALRPRHGVEHRLDVFVDSKVCVFRVAQILEEFRTPARIGDRDRVAVGHYRIVPQISHQPLGQKFIGLEPVDCDLALSCRRHGKDEDPFVCPDVEEMRAILR